MPSVGELGRARPEGHDDLLERRVAGALAEAVDRDLDLARAGLDGGERVGRREPEVVVAVDADRRVRADEVDDPPDERAELGRDRVADGVRDVDRRGAGLDDRLVDLEQEVGVGARGVLGARTRSRRRGPSCLAAVADPADRLGERLVAVDPELVLEVDVARRDEDVEVRPLGDLDRLDRPLRVAVAAAGERRDRDPALGLLGDPPDRLEVAGRGGREAGLDDVDLEPGELAGDLELLGRGQPGARRLLAVAQGRVEDPDAARRARTAAAARRVRAPRRSSAPRPRRRSAAAWASPASTDDRVEERHLGPQLGADLLDLVVAVLLRAAARTRSPPDSLSAIQRSANEPPWMSARTSFIVASDALVDDPRAATRSRRTRRCR